jgi:hypothetical protein
MILESTLDITRSDRDQTILISGNKLGTHINEIFAYDTLGNQIHLSVSEEIRAEYILLKHGKRKDES